MTPEMDIPLDNHCPHVQVYAVLNAAVGEYELIGPGYLSILDDEVEGATVHYLEAKNKQGETLMLSRLRPDNGYEKQRGSVIAWRDVEQKEHKDLALSFSDENECDFIWRLVCEKIGKNYLQISRRGDLEIAREDNLTYILEQTHKSKDMVEYHILNSGRFLEGLTTTFAAFKAAKDEMGMGMVGRILKAILNNVDHRLVQKLFSDPAFGLLLQVQQFCCNINFPALSEANTSLKTLVPLPAVIAEKVQLIHRITFYRQNVLNLAKESYFEHILILTQTESYKELIIELSRSEALTSVLQAHTLEANRSSDDKDMETVKIDNMEEPKLEFLMECLMLLKQGQSDNNKRKLIQRLHQPDVQELAVDALDQGMVKAVDFYVCLSQADPHSFLELLQRPHPFNKDKTIISTLAEKYCRGPHELRLSMMEIFKMLGETFKHHQNVELVIKHFVKPVFSECSEAKAVLLLANELQNTLDSVQLLFEALISASVLKNVANLLINFPRAKENQLRALKLLKRLIVQTAFSAKKVGPNRSSLMDSVNEEAISSGFFEQCMQVLRKNIFFNNVISSSMLENLKLISELTQFTVYHQYLQDHNHEMTQLTQRKEVYPLINRILATSPKEATAPDIHRVNLEQEQEESYLMQENHDELKQAGSVHKASMEEIHNQMQSLKALTQEIQSESRQEEEDREEQELLQAGAARKRRKENEEIAPVLTIELKLDFDDDEGNE